MQLLVHLHKIITLSGRNLWQRANIIGLLRLCQVHKQVIIDLVLLDQNFLSLSLMFHCLASLDHISQLPVLLIRATNQAVIDGGRGAPHLLHHQCLLLL